MHLVKRRLGYREYPLDSSFAYAHEVNGPDDLGVVKGDEVSLLPKLIEDVRSVSDDPDATFFYLEMQNRESVEDAIKRGLALPVSRHRQMFLHANKERRSAKAFCGG